MYFLVTPNRSSTIFLKIFFFQEFVVLSRNWIYSSISRINKTFGNYTWALKMDILLKINQAFILFIRNLRIKEVVSKEVRRIALLFLPQKNDGKITINSWPISSVSKTCLSSWSRCISRSENRWGKVRPSPRLEKTGSSKNYNKSSIMGQKCLK